MQNITPLIFCGILVLYIAHPCARAFGTFRCVHDVMPPDVAASHAESSVPPGAHRAAEGAAAGWCSPLAAAGAPAWGKLLLPDGEDPRQQRQEADKSTIHKLQLWSVVYADHRAAAGMMGLRTHACMLSARPGLHLQR